MLVAVAGFARPPAEKFPEMITNCGTWGVIVIVAVTVVVTGRATTVAVEVVVFGAITEGASTYITPTPINSPITSPTITIPVDAPSLLMLIS
jgi:hypothetical protein